MEESIKEQDLKPAETLIATLPPESPPESQSEQPNIELPSPEERSFEDGFFSAVSEPSPHATKPSPHAGVRASEPSLAVKGDREAVDEVALRSPDQSTSSVTFSDSSPACGEALERSPRDWAAEWRELAAAHPEVIGQELPQEIYEACLNSPLPPLRVYESMMLSRLGSEIEALRQENAALRQNAEASARAPVTPSSGGVNNAPEDSFLRGFNLRYSI